MNVFNPVRGRDIAVAIRRTGAGVGAMRPAPLVGTPGGAA